MPLIVPKETEPELASKRLAWISRIHLKASILLTRSIRPSKDGHNQNQLAGISIHCQAMLILKETSPIGAIGQGKKQLSSLHMVGCGKGLKIPHVEAL